MSGATLIGLTPEEEALLVQLREAEGLTGIHIHEPTSTRTEPAPAATDDARPVLKAGPATTQQPCGEPAAEEEAVQVEVAALQARLAAAEAQAAEAVAQAEAARAAAAEAVRAAAEQAAEAEAAAEAAVAAAALVVEGAAAHAMEAAAAAQAAQASSARGTATAMDCFKKCLNPKAAQAEMELRDEDEITSPGGK